MRIGFLTFIFALLASVDAFAATVTPIPAYKLGNTYKPEPKSDKECLEGHAGAMLGNAGCGNSAQGCKNNSECEKFGTGYVCAKGYDGKAARGVCRYQECSGPGDTSCSKKYSHLRSCVKNEIGVFECRITCNWTKVMEAGKGYIGSTNIAARMQFEYKLWNEFSSTPIQPKYMTKTALVADNWYTCENGKVTKCARNSLEKTVSESEWDNGNNDGIKYRPCLPCSIASEGTWGIGTEERISKVGKRPYSAVSRSKINRRIIDKEYVASTGNALAVMPVDACANETALKSEDIFEKLNNATTFPTYTGYGGGSEYFTGLSGAVELGTSPICFAWHTKPDFHYVTSKYTGASCPYPCLATTILAPMVYIPQQKATRKLPRADTPTEGQEFVSHSFNRKNGTLLCCAISAKQSSVNSTHIKHCIVVK